MNDLSKLTLKELAAFVSHYLRGNGIANVLTGGACVSIYTENRYMSYDLDFVNIEENPISKIKAIIEEIGFTEKGRIFINRDFNYSVDICTIPARPFFKFVSNSGVPPFFNVEVTSKGFI